MISRLRPSVILVVTAVVAAAFAGSFASSASAGDTVTIASAPDAPVLTATAHVGAVHLDWTVPLDNGTAITTYNVYRSDSTGAGAGGETLLVDAGNVTTFDDTSLATNGTQYFYEVTAVNNDGESAFSNEQSAIPLTGIPDAPVLTASALVHGVHLSWTAPSGNGGTITNYNIYQGTSANTESFLVQVGNVLTFDNTPLVADGTQYFYKVTALVGAVEGPPSNEDSAIPVTGIPDPPVLSAAPMLNGVHLSWTAADGHGSPITHYRVYRSDSTGSGAGGETLLIELGDVLTFDDTPLAIDGTEYFYTVSAVTSVQESLQSNEASVTLTGIPDAPVLTATAMLNGIHLSWTAPSGNGVTITNYKISRSTTTGTEVFVVQVGNVLTFDDAPLANDGTQYFYEVSAVAGVQEGAKSNEASAIPTPDPTGEYTSLTPARVLDTRGDPTINCPANAGLEKLGENATMDVQVKGCGGVPNTGVSAVVVNVTVADPTGDSFLTVWPTGAPQPLISNLNFLPGQVVPNLVTVAVGAGGKLSVYNKFGATQVIVDVVGYYADSTGTVGSRFHGVNPSRFFDTRDGTGFVPVGQVGPDGVLPFKVTGKNGVPGNGNGVTAVVMNVTVTGPTADSFLTVYPADVVVRPTASNLNFTAGQTVPNLVIVHVPASGIVDFYNKRGFTHVLADVVGYYDGDKTTDAGRFVPVTPARRIDTRVSSPFPPPGRIGAGFSLLTRLPGTAGLPALGMGSVVLNVTATEPAADGFLTVYPPDAPLPFVSNLNFVAGQTVPNLVMVKVSAGPPTITGATGAGWLGFYNPYGATHVIVDVFGYFTASSPGVTGASADASTVGDTPSLALAP